jgi:hypothetical protein
MVWNSCQAKGEPMTRSLALLIGLAIAMLVLPLGLSAGSANSAGRARVVCLNDKTFNPKYKVRPKHCIFHKRHAPKRRGVLRPHQARPLAGVESPSRSRQGQGDRQHDRLNAGEDQVVEPVRRCGHRVFSKAHFRFPKLNHGGGMNLVTCA